MIVYVIKRQQLYPEGDPVAFRDQGGRLFAFQDKASADRAVMDLYSDPHNKGWRFIVETVASAGDPVLDQEAENRTFEV